MDKTSILLKLCYKFSKKYIAGYFSALGKPILFAVIGIFLFLTVLISPNLALISLLSIPFLCYAFWRGYVVTYALIPCAKNFVENTALPFDNFVKEVKNNEGELAKYVLFIAVLTIILYFPAFIYTILKMPAVDLYTNPQAFVSAFNGFAFLLSNVLMAPFLNFFLCAYYFKKENESYFDLFLNCYKKLDVLGFMIALIITLFALKGGVLYTLLALLLNLFIYSINTCWYLSRIKK